MNRPTPVFGATMFALLLITLMGVEVAFGAPEDAYAYHLQHDPGCMVVMERRPAPQGRQFAITFWECPEGVSQTEPKQMFSATKLYSLALFGWGEDSGHWSETDQVSDFIAEFSVPAPQGQTWDSSLYSVTRLATDYPGDAHRIGYACFPDACVENYVEHVPTIPSEYPAWVPNEGVWRYGPVNHQLFGTIFIRETGRDPTDVLSEMNIPWSDWNRDDAGNPWLSAGAFVTAVEAARYGAVLILQGDWLASACANPADPNPGHGLFAWCNRDGGYGPRFKVFDPEPGVGGGFLYPDGKPGIVAGMGAGGQRIYIDTEDEVVIVRQCDSQGYESCAPTFRDRDFLTAFYGQQGIGPILP